MKYVYRKMWTALFFFCVSENKRSGLVFPAFFIPVYFESRSVTSDWKVIPCFLVAAAMRICRVHFGDNSYRNLNVFIKFAHSVLALTRNTCVAADLQIFKVVISGGIFSLFYVPPKWTCHSRSLRDEQTFFNSHGPQFHPDSFGEIVNRRIKKKIERGHFWGPTQCRE